MAKSKKEAKPELERITIRKMMGEEPRKPPTVEDIVELVCEVKTMRDGTRYYQPMDGRLLFPTFSVCSTCNGITGCTNDDGVPPDVIVAMAVMEEAIHLKWYYDKQMRMSSHIRTSFCQCAKLRDQMKDEAEALPWAKKGEWVVTESRMCWTAWEKVMTFSRLLTQDEEKLLEKWLTLPGNRPGQGAGLQMHDDLVKNKFRQLDHNVWTYVGVSSIDSSD